MRFLFPFFLLVLVSAQNVVGQSTTDRLGAVADELDAIVDDLEASQAQAASLRGRLTVLEDLSAEHQAALADQDRLLVEYRASVAALEAHDRTSLDLAQDLKGQLASERVLTGWLVSVAGVAAAVAVVEGLILVLK